MERRTCIVILFLIAIAGMARDRYVETYEGSRIIAPMPLDSALTVPFLSFADCEITSSAFLRYDQRGDTAVHETLSDTRRDFKVDGSGLLLYRQEWVNRYFQPDSMIPFNPDGVTRAFIARMRRDQCIHSRISGEFSTAVYVPQVLVISPGDTLNGVIAQAYRLDGRIAYTDYNYTRTDSVDYPVRYETVYWYAPGLRHPSAAWERYSYTGDSVPVMQYEKTYVFPGYENRTVPPVSTKAPARQSVVAKGGYSLAGDSDLHRILSSIDDFTENGEYGGSITSIEGFSALKVEPAADAGECSILLCDVAGRVLLSRISHGETVFIESLPPGDYLLSISDSGGRYLRKILIR